MNPAKVAKRCTSKKTASESMFLVAGIFFLSMVAFGGQEMSMKELAGSYFDDFGMRLNIFGDEKSGWKAKFMTVNKTTVGDYYCQIEGLVSLSKDELVIKSQDCVVRLAVSKEKISFKNGVDDKRERKKCNCGGRGSWFVDFLRSKKQEKLVDFEFPG